MRDAILDDAAARATAGVVDTRLTALQLSLAAFRLPILTHCAFNAIAAAGMVLLGHPVLAALLFVGASAFDAVQQHLLKRWLAASEGADEARGLRKLAALCAVRTLVYTAPTFAMATTGGAAELMFYGLQLATLLTVGVGASTLCRIVFWAFATPMAASIVALTAVLFDPAAAGAVLLNLLILLAIVGTISFNATTTISAWHKAFVQSVADRAVAEAAHEAARETSRARSAFLATMSHEIRTPMNGVLGMAQLLRRDEADPAQIARLDVLIDSGEYLLSILNDILDVSKIDAGKLAIVTAPEDLRAFLERVVGFWTPRAAERRVALGLQVAADAPERLMLDGLRLRQVLFNLIGNALKFTEAGAVDVIADAAPTGPDTVRLHIAVRDTGLGIAPHNLPKLFERFSQADGAEARRFDGAGLGLSIVKQLVELMDGYVWVESELGVGSIFHLEVPLALAHDEAPVAEPLAAAAPAPVASGELRILAIDDNAVNLLVLEQLLTSLGHTVAKAGGGEEALRTLAEESFDLVLTDIQMPRIGGTEVLQRVRAAPGPNRHVPMIALTADVTSGGRQHYLDEGFTEHSSKPIQLQDLLSSIDRAVSAKSERAEQVA